ncbi:hypothetical protein JG687_00007126 [Phytophthora cactorum]|uniref:Uncharacterized protein n=1 Tax=Phytophthora cactorum TaxID=29920 RepID=A0A329T0U5_9STRA|nr:hypothetical protein Pcac1_g14389 [Phytophthora cactorum]KAG2910024.1 hypothetical protein PC114_g9902 [Phytophthora cactorum]KAG2951791.1 hypothetical protein PC117_g3339 [Phytophthora cactorum]KAG3079687.1 hypothetical protein PC121_g6906 [Phytophthora cactorum]KAG3087601.1 hypothetical protein PC122_g8767 [Phytophthora cactorum]
MGPMRRPGEALSGYEDWTTNETELLAESIVETIVFGVTLQWSTKSITEQVFKSDVMACLAMVTGGQARENDLAPNTWRQNLNITKRLGHVETDPFVQSCMTKLDADTYLAAVFVRHEPGFGIEAVRSEPPPPPSRLVFF